MVLFMRTSLMRLIGALCASTMAAALFAQNNDAKKEAETRTRLLALQHAWSQAERFGDLKALDLLLDEDLVYVDFDGNLMAKAAFLARMKATHLQKAVSELMTVEVFDDTAIVNGTYRSDEFNNGKIVRRRERFTNTWVYKRSTWVCIAAQSTPILREEER